MTNTITLQDIVDNPNLRDLGVSPGDTYTVSEDGTPEITRIFSNEDYNIKRGVAITEEDLAAYPNLVEQGVAPGDRYIEETNEIIKTGNDSIAKQFMYGFDTAGNFIGYGANLLEAMMPLGRFDLSLDKGFTYYSPEEAYGPGFNQADFDTRREMILRARERQILEEYGPYFDPEDGAAQAAGEIVGAIADPTSLIPLGQTIKAAAATAGALGAGYSVLEDLAKTGEIDPAKAALFGIGGAATGGALVGAGRGLAKVAEKTQLNKANRTIDEAEQIMNRDIAAGVSTNSAFNKMAESELAPRLSEAIQLTGRKLKVNSSPSVAQRAIDTAITNDSVFSRFTIPGVDKLISVVSTEIGKISPATLNRMRRHEMDVFTNTQKALQTAEPFIRQMRQLPTALKLQVSTHLFNGETSKAVALMPNEMKTTFTPVRTLLDDIYEDVKESGIEFGYVENHFPRMVKDYDGLRHNLGLEETNELDKILQKVANDKKTTVDLLDYTEKVQLTNRWLRGFLKPDGKPAFTKQRKIDILSPEQVEKFYYSPEDSLALYIRNAINNSERNKFFGRYIKGGEESLKKFHQGSQEIRESIGEVVQNIDKDLNATDQVRLSELIQSRFVGGEQTPNRLVSSIRDAGYAGTIANPVSALIQLGDLANSAALHGFGNTISALFKAKDIKLVDIGISELQQELSENSQRWTAKQLNKLFKLSGFKAIDRLSRETTMNASFRKNMNLVKTSKGENLFRQKWGKFYGDEIEGVINDLKSGRITDNVKFHSFNELSDMQPISMLEMPEPYLNNPNGRILYMLKSFTIKQLDIVRRNVLQEWAKGNKKQAVKQAALLAAYLTTANLGIQTVRDIILTRDVKPEQLPNNALWALLGVYGLNEYITDRYFSRGQVKEGLISMITPATPLIDAALKVGSAPFQEDPSLAPLLRNVPLVGPLIYNWFGGGAEKYNERLAKES